MSVIAADPSVLASDPFADRRVLVLLASYRDPELPRTISNALAQAAYPEHLRFSICHQFDDTTANALKPWKDDPRFSIDEVPFSESSGCCWARARTFARYDDEPYILQVDAHTRFAARWDVRYIEMLESLDSERPILTCYPPSYTVDDEGQDHYLLDGGIHRLALIRLQHDLTTRQRTERVEDASAPGPSPLLAAGQIFARGSFCTDVPYDPEIYFAGEEISLAVRAFTNGYDLFYPNENLVWHRYGHGERLHWQDHPEEQNDLHAVAVDRLKTLLSDRGAELGTFGLGSARTLAEFEKMADLDFSSQGSGSGWLLRGPLELNTSSIDFDSTYRAWVFAVFAENGKELYRHDITDAEILTGASRTIEVSTDDLEDKPSTYILWPVFSDGTFGERASHPLDPEVIVAPPDFVVDEDIPASNPSIDSSGTRIAIDRSIIEPRDDYVVFTVVLLDRQGAEVSRVDLSRPDVLDLSIGELTLHDVDPVDAIAYAVIPTRRNGKTDAIRVQPLERP